MLIGLATQQMLSDWLTSGEHFVSQCLAVKLNTGRKYKLLAVDEKNVHEKFGLARISYHPRHSEHLIGIELEIYSVQSYRCERVVPVL